MEKYVEVIFSVLYDDFYYDVFVEQSLIQWRIQLLTKGGGEIGVNPPPPKAWDFSLCRILVLIFNMK
jgi:hypothetical protein